MGRLFSRLFSESYLSDFTDLYRCNRYTSKELASSLSSTTSSRIAQQLLSLLSSDALSVLAPITSDHKSILDVFFLLKRTNDTGKRDEIEIIFNHPAIQQYLLIDNQTLIYLPDHVRSTWPLLSPPLLYQYLTHSSTLLLFMDLFPMFHSLVWNGLRISPSNDTVFEFLCIESTFQDSCITLIRSLFGGLYSTPFQSAPSIPSEIIYEKKITSFLRNNPKALMYASSRGHVRVFESIFRESKVVAPWLEYAVSLPGEEEDGETCLFTAARFDQDALFHYLITLCSTYECLLHLNRRGRTILEVAGPKVQSILRELKCVEQQEKYRNKKIN